MYSIPDEPSRDWILYPAIGRIHNFLAQGRDNYAADRAVAFRLLEEDPWLGQTVRTTQVHRAAVVTYLAREHNIRQFLDLGCGLPRNPLQHPEEPNETRSTYEIARTVHADAAVVFVDNDPRVAGHAGAVWAGHATTRSICADIRAIDDLLAHADISIFDLDRPIGVLLHEVLPWVEDESAHAVTDALRAWLPAGSALSLLHSRADVTPEVMDSRVSHYADAGITYRPRTPEQIHALLAPWTPPPGQIPAPAAGTVYSTVVTDLLPPDLPIDRSRPNRELLPTCHAPRHLNVFTHGTARGPAQGRSSSARRAARPLRARRTGDHPLRGGGAASAPATRPFVGSLRPARLTPARRAADDGRVHNPPTRLEQGPLADDARGDTSRRSSLRPAALRHFSDPRLRSPRAGNKAPPAAQHTHEPGGQRSRHRKGENP